MIKEFNTSISYVCPFCSSITIKDINVFSLASIKPNPFFCEDETGCGAVCVSILPKRNTYEISVSCPICEDTHTFNIGKTRFWNQDKPLVLNCPEAGLGIIFIGNHSEIYSLIMEQESSIMQEAEGFAPVHRIDIIFQIIEQINNLSLNEQIHCSCGSRHISIGIDTDNVMLACRDCGRSKTISPSADELEKLLKASAIVLD